MLDGIAQVLGRKSSVSTRIEQTKSLILEMGRERKKLSCDLEAEETRAGIGDPTHYAYSPLAKTLRERRDRLERSIDTLAKKLAEYEAGLATSVDEQNPVTTQRVRKRYYWGYDRKSARTPGSQLTHLATSYDGSRNAPPSPDRHYREG
jgi:ribosome modulation factor